MPAMTRRAGLAGMLATPLAALMPAALAARPAPEEAFRGALDRMVLPLDGSSLTLETFAETRDGATVALSADIRLTWPPGVRHRRFAATGGDAEAAFGALVTGVLAEFDATLPGGGA